MKQIRVYLTIIVTALLMSTLTGCQVLMLPYYVLGSMFAVIGQLIPMAVRVLPVALLFVQVHDESSENIKLVQSTNMIAEQLSVTDAYSIASQQNSPDGFEVIEQEMFDKHGRRSERMLIFACDASVPTADIAARIMACVPPGSDVNITAHVVNGASFCNEKYRFFLTLDKLAGDGVDFHAIGTLEPAVALMNQTRRAK